MGMIAHNRAEWDDIGDQNRSAADKCMIADPAELMHGDRASEPDLLANRHVPANMRIVRDDALIPQHAIMRRVGMRHEQTVCANLGQTAMFWRPCVEGCMLPHNGARANL